MKEISYYMQLPYVLQIRPIAGSEGGGFMACIPFLGDGAFLGDGKTEAEAVQALRDVQRTIFERMIEEDDTIPEPPVEEEETYSGRFVLRIPPKLHAQIATSAELAGKSMNNYVQQILEQHESERARPNPDTWTPARLSALAARVDVTLGRIEARIESRRWPEDRPRVMIDLAAFPSGTFPAFGDLTTHIVATHGPDISSAQTLRLVRTGSVYRSLEPEPTSTEWSSEVLAQKENEQP